MQTRNPLILLFMLITPAALSVCVYMCTIYTCVCFTERRSETHSAELSHNNPIVAAALARALERRGQRKWPQQAAGHSAIPHSSNLKGSQVWHRESLKV